MQDQIKVTLSSPTKLDLRVLVAGMQTVSAQELQHLQDAGVVVEIHDGSDDQGLAADNAVGDGDILGAAAAKIVALEEQLAEVIAATDETGLMYEGRIQSLTAELKAERQKSADLAEKLTAATAELDAPKAGATATAQNNPAVKTSPKKAVVQG